MELDPFCVFLQGSLLVIVIMIDGSENAVVTAALQLDSSRVCEKCSKEDLCVSIKFLHLSFSLEFAWVSFLRFGP